MSSKIPLPSGTRNFLKRTKKDENNSTDEQLQENKKPKLEAPRKKATLAKPHLRRSVSMINIATATNILGSKQNQAAKNDKKSVKKPLHPKVINGTLQTTSLSTPACNSVPVPRNPKRAAWDLKGRLQDSEEARKKLLEERGFYKEKCSSLEEKYNKTLNSIQRKTEECIQLEKNNINFKERLERTEHEFFEIKNRNSVLESENKKLNSYLFSVNTENSEMKREVSTSKEHVATLTGKLMKMEEELQEKTIRNEYLENKIVALEDANKDLQHKLHCGEKLRRNLHNTILDLKGNIRVFCRVRPLIARELELHKETCVSFPDPDHRTVVLLSNSKDISLNESVANTQGKNNANAHEFTFDRVFDPTTSQAEVFEEITQLVQSALDGYNVCIFAYGPTGSGKTYTMEGQKNDGINSPSIGMIPRSMEQIFTSIEELQKRGWVFEMKASFLEIYNEMIRDLLCIKGDKLDLKLNKENEVYVNGLTMVGVDERKQIVDLLKKAEKNRAVAETKCNERSSRSHSVFTLNITGYNSELGEHCRGILNLIDLAGSERVKISGSEGDRLREAQNINKSLSNLGNVIMALSQKNEYVPFRNSKLTHLLMNSLKGNSKMLMFINISSCEDAFNESLNSLRFAKMVNECCIGAAVRKK